MDPKEKDILFDWLRTIVEDKYPNTFETVEQSIFDSLLLYMKDSIPNDVFLITTDKIQNSLIEYNNDINILNEKFFKRGKVPFTIRRVCELVYDPLKYVQQDQFTKFVNALKKCIYVESDYDFELKQNFNHLVDQNQLSLCPSSLSPNISLANKEISMSQIPFMPKENGDSISELKIKREYNEFLKEIDSVMSVNYEYDEEEDINEDMEITVGDLNEDGLEFDDEEDEDYVEEGSDEEERSDEEVEEENEDNNEGGVEDKKETDKQISE